MNKAVIAILVIVIVGGGAWWIVKSQTDQTAQTEQTPQTNEQTGQTGQTNTNGVNVEVGGMVSVGTKEFTVTGSDFTFTPNKLTVNKGDTVKITFKNVDGIHDLMIDEFGVATKQIKAGGSETVSFVADKTGSFEFYCSVGQHRAMGMKGTLVVH